VRLQRKDLCPVASQFACVFSVHRFSCLCVGLYYRKTLPAPMISRCDYSVWGILKKCIGMVRMSPTLLCPQNHPLYRRTNRNHNKATNWMTFCFTHILQRSSYKRFRVNVINKLLSINDSIHLFCVYTGAVQDNDAHRVQRAPEFPPENVRVHGTHSPHPQSLHPVRLHRPHAGKENRWDTLTPSPQQGL
jgi:hypothetical protein